MKYSDNQYKLVAILNKKVDIATLLNALAHITAGIVASQNTSFSFLKYTNNLSPNFEATISEFPIIILSSDNGSKLQTLYEAIKNAEDGFMVNAFTNTMIGSSAEVQLHRTQEEALEYWGVILFGEAEKLQPFTKKFSLFK